MLDFYENENVSAQALTDKFDIEWTQATDLIKINIRPYNWYDEIKTIKCRKLESINVNNVVYEWKIILMIKYYNKWTNLYVVNNFLVLHIHLKYIFK